MSHARGTYRGTAEPYLPMIAKIVKGGNFRGVVNYILDKEKDAKILVCDGLFSENKDKIVMSFEAQSGMNPRVTKPVGHIALAFSREDKHRLTDRTMAGIALEYLERMGIKDTQALVVRHLTRSIRTCISHSTALQMTAGQSATGTSEYEAHASARS